MPLINKTRNSIIAKKPYLADTFFLRLKGLLGKSALDADSALVITPCKSIHTFFMKFSIDVLFLNSKNKIIALHRNLKPWRLSPIYFKANSVIELPAGIIQKNSLEIGDEIVLE